MNSYKKSSPRTREKFSELNPSWEWAGREIEFHLANFEQETETALASGTGRSSFRGCERSRALRLAWEWTGIVNPTQCTEEKRREIAMWYRRFLTVLRVVEPASPAEKKKIEEFGLNLRMRLNDVRPKQTGERDRAEEPDLLEDVEKAGCGLDFTSRSVRQQIRSLCHYLLRQEVRAS